MPFEVVLALLVLFVAFPAVLFRGVARVRQARSSAGAKPGIRASELRAIVREAVEDATAPLHDRIDTLEGLLMGDTVDRDPRPASRIDAGLLDDPDDDLQDSDRREALRVRD